MNLIVAPHPDDEILGCYELLREVPYKCIVLMVDTNISNIRKEEAKKVSKVLGVRYRWTKPENMVRDIENIIKAYNIGDILVPSIDDVDEHHRLVNGIGYYIAKIFGLRFIEYTTRMNTNYTRKCKYPDTKLETLKLYKSQNWIWKGKDHKWWLFEGRIIYD